MIYKKYFIFVYLLLFSFCLCEVSKEQQEKLLSGFIDYYNNLPNQIYTCEEGDGSVQNVQKVDETTYQIGANLNVTKIRNIDVTKTLECIATVEDSNNELTFTSYQCHEHGQPSPADTSSQEQVPEVTEPTLERKPVKLENEVQFDTAITSGEQFIAIPRDQPSAPCVGCASHVNPQAAGVSDLASLGVRHLEIHDPTVKHSLDSVIDVERQVQVVNGVRYILTLSIKFNNCVEEESDNCVSSKACKITILVKPWVKLPNGGNYRAILGNNCTEEWHYGDNGEVLPEPSTDNHEHDANADDIQVKHNTDDQSQPNQEGSLTNEEIRNLQDQIIPNSKFKEGTEINRESFTISRDMPGVSKQHVFKAESGKHSENSIPVSDFRGETQTTSNINPDKKKAIDEMLSFFEFSGLNSNTELKEDIPRVKRSYDYDLQVLSLADDFHGIKKSLENARFMYEMAQAMVDYLNEMDMEVKHRVVKNVIKAEEEIENLQRFVYVQARVTIPCDKVECESRDADNQICNGVIDSTSEKNPQIINAFCYNDNKERNYRDVIEEISFDDPVLQKLAKEAVKKMESELNSQYALKINKIVSATTQVTSGRLTKISVIIDNINCNKSVPLALRVNCMVLEQLGSKICEILIHERHWLKERKISYTCTDRPVDMRISKSKSIIKNVTIDDPKIIEMLQEAIQYLETQSDKNNKQKIVNIKSISTQIIAGFLTKIEFVVGYTNCTDENYSRDESNKCELLSNLGLRLCKAQIWDRSWIMDGRQVEVSCDDVEKSNEIEKARRKRSIDTVDSDSELQQNIKNNNIEYVKLAHESLKKFLHSSLSRLHYKVVKIDRVTSQNVPGKLTNIEFSISPTNCLIQTDGLPSLSNCDIINPKQTFRCRSKILEGIWLDKTQYFVNCNTKDQEQLSKTNSDGLIERNPSDLKFYKLADQSLQKYLNETGISPNFKIVRVEKVTTLIISGLLTSIEFIISNQNEHSGNISCHSNILEKHWLGTKDYNVSCQMKKTENSNVSIEEKPDNIEYMHIAVESLQKYLKYKPDSQLVRVTFVDKVIKAGDITKIIFIASHAEDDDGDTICHTEFSERGLVRSDFEVKCNLIGAVLRKTEIGEDPKFTKYLKLADECLHKYLQTINSSQLYTIMSIENVTVNWDEGINTLIDFIVTPIDLDSDIRGLRCLSQIEEQPWLHQKHINVKCEEERDLYRRKRQLPKEIIMLLGVETVEDPTEPEVKILAEISLKKYVQNSDITTPYRVVRVEKVTRKMFAQVVPLVRIDFIASDSLKSKTIQCHSKVWDRPWLNKEEIDVSCEDANQRVKRQILGGEKVEDPTKPEYKILADESLNKYIQDSGITTPHKVVRVEKVTSQPVAGTLTQIDFIVSDSQKSSTLKCHSKVWDRPWLNKKEIDVFCEKDEYRSKREVMTGAPMEQNPADPEYKLLAEESLKKYVQDSGITTPHKVVRVERVTSQPVAGTLTRIDFIVSNSQESSTLKCHSKVWDRPWLNKKEIDVSCEKDEYRSKREVMTGAPMEQNPADPEYKLLAEESLKKYVQDSGITSPHKVVRVERVTSQPVAGTLTRIDFIVSNSQESSTLKCHSKVWDRPWLNKKEIDVSCEDANQRVKRQILGGEKVEDPTKPEYKILADESLNKYVQDSGITTPHKVVRVERVTSQPVAGTLTRIDFIVSNSQESSTLKCHSKVWDRPWLNNKEIDVSCEKDEYRSKREVMTGAPMEQNPADPEYKLLAEESLKKYVQDSGITSPHKVVRVERVTSQQVAGTLTRIDFIVSNSQESSTLKCHSKVWDRPWLNKKEIDVSCEDANQRVKRQILGGEKVEDPTKPEYKILADKSLNKYVQDSGITTPHKVVRVEKVTSQPVAGTLTRIDFIVSNSQESSTLKCHSKVWDRPWLNNKEIDVSCEKDEYRSKREVMTGAPMEQNPADPEYKLLAEESLKKYVQDSGITTPHKVERVERVTSQPVAGTLTRIDFIVSKSQESSTLKCHSEVWDRPWLNKKEIDVSCEDANHRVKRQRPGGVTVEDPTKPKYKILAEESLTKYVQDSGITTPHKVVRVEKVTSQPVAGTLTHIDFIVSDSQESITLKCHSKVWDRPWLNKKEIDVSCEDANQRVKRQILGGEKVEDPTKPEYKILAEESLNKYVQDSGITTPHKVVRVEKVTSQPVAGTLTRIDFIVCDSQKSSTLKCHSKVWDRPWLNNKEIDVSCEDANQRVKRQILGGEKIEDPTKPEYKILADESLNKYVQDSGITTPHKVVRVERVTSQPVAGTLTRIDFIVSNSQESSTLKCHSKVWDRPWLNNKEIDVSCEKDEYRSKREVMTGAPMEQNPADPEYKLLAEESLKKYVQDSGITSPHKVVRVERVTSQLVAGTLTRIDFIVSNSQESSTLKCHSKVWDRPWLNKKEIDVSCEDANQRVKRQILGGEKVEDPTKPEYKILADESLNKYVQDSGITTPHKVVRVEKVTSQPVAGTLTRIDFIVSNSQESSTLKCHSKVWDRPWLNNKEIDVSCEKDEYRSKREVMTGAPMEQNPADPEYKLLAEESLKKYVQDSGITTPHKVERVERVTSQPVAGTLIRIDFIVSNSQESITLKCHSKVWDRPWLNKKEIDVSCEDANQRVKRQILGGEKVEDPTKPEYKILAEESLNKYVQDSGITTPHKVVRVEKVTSQPVAGTLTRIDFIVYDSQKSSTLKCHSKVWDRPWLNNKEIDVSCEKDEYRSKREVMTGAPMEQNPADPEYKLLAEESLKKYVQDSGITTPHKVERVERVTSQPVAGTLTRIDFIVSNSQESSTLKCHSEVWDRPWLNKKEIDVSCEDANHRVKRQRPGGVTVEDPTKPKYKILAEESLTKYVQDSGITTPHKVVRVEKVTSQPVAGTLTHIDFIVSDSQESITLKCHSKVWDRPWLNKKEIDVSCEDANQRVKRQILGGEKVEDPTKPEYKILADESLNKYVQDSGITTPHKVVRVEKVTSQPVAGTLTRIDFIVSNSQESSTLKCHSKVWDRPWLNNKEIDVSCEKDEYRSKREVMTGAPMEQNPADPEYKLLAEESLKKYVQDSGITTPHKVERVERVTSQPVAGTLIRIDFIVSNSQQSITLKCHSKVWDRPWLNKKEIDVSCEDANQRVKRQILGGEKVEDPTKPEYKILAEESLNKYVQDSGITTPHKVVRVEKVTSQPVAGTLTRIDFIVCDSQKSSTLKCHSKVWDRPWLNNKEIDVSCEKDEYGSKREVMTGAPMEQNPADPEYKLLAEESLKKYVQDSGITTPHKVVRVERVTSQPVAGTLTRIDFIVSNSQESSTLKCHSKVWDRPWLNKKEIDVSCEDANQRVKRQILGGEKVEDPTKPEYKILADESLNKYVQDSGITTPHKVVRVERVTSQPVAGTLTRIDFIVSNSQESSTLKCHSKVWDRPWLNKKEIDVSCEDANQRVKRQILGGEKVEDPTKPEYKILADESLNKYVQDSGITTPHKVVRVERVTSQPVAGTLTRIDFIVSNSQESSTLKCHSKVWDRPWLNNKEIDVSCEKDEYRSKREVMTGAPMEQNPADPEYKLLAEESLKKYVQDSGITSPHKVVRVERVTSQLVAGTLTRIDFIVSNSQESSTLKCHSKVWDRPWLNRKEIDVSCEDANHRVKRQRPGGVTVEDPTKPEYKILADESLNKYVQDSGITTPHKVVRVEKVTSQPVAGTLTHIDFIVSDSQESITLKCHSKVWDRPWLNKKEIDVSCEDANQRVKRQILGGEKVEDPTKPEYKILADESLNKYVQDSGITTPHKVVRVEKVTSQPVAGTLTNIDFIVSDSQESSTLKCHSKVWDRPWLNKKEIDVSCEDANHRVKRQRTGGVTVEDPTKPKYKILAEESLNKYVQDSGITTPHKVVRVEKVTSQPVAGTLIHIDFIVSDSQESSTLKCHSKVWDRPWLNKKEIDVSCEDANQRVKRQIAGGVTAENTTKPEYKILAEESLNKYVQDSGITTPHKVQPRSGILKVRGHFEEAQDPNKPEYKLLAEESLRKYQQKGSIHHKVIEIKRVLTRVVSGIKYKIYFIASPTTCSVNVTNVFARNCQPIEDVVLYCHTEIWDRPWLKSKKIEIHCYGPDDDNFDEHVSDTDTVAYPSDLKNNDKRYKFFAEEAADKYLTTSNRKYVHKVTEIHSVSEHMVDGTITKIEFSLSPTACLRNETRTANDSCEVKKPLIVLHCNANIWDRPWLHIEKEISVTCKKISKLKPKKHKRELGDRIIRQIGDDDDEMDEDIVYYYADRAVQHVNDQSSSNNLHKLVTIHAVQNSVQMGATTVLMYIDIAETYCLRHHKDMNLNECEEMDGLNHRLCYARLWPSPDDELVVRHVSVVCHDDQDFVSITGVNIPELLRMSIEGLERSPETKYKLVHQGEPQIIPSLDSRIPFKLNFVVATTNCSKDVNLDKNPFQCYINTAKPSKACHSFIWLKADTRFVRYINAKCTPPPRSKRSLSDPANLTLDNLEIQKLVTASLNKLEMSSLHRYKQRVLQINSHSTRITSGKVTTIDFDVGYTSCLKYEWVENITSCDFLEHLPRRRCVAQIWERLWINNGKNIDVNCVDDDTPLESHIEFESAEIANELAREALKHIEAKYPHPSKQKVVRIFSLEKQVVAGIHYRMKVEVGFTDCVALSEQTDCKLLNNMVNKFCRVNVWDRPWTDHPPNFRVSCDFQEGSSHEFYHHVQAEHLFYHFLTTYSPSYQNDYSQMQKRFDIFKNNIKKIHDLNVHEKGTATYGVTRFADLSYEEFSSTYMGLKTNLSDANQVPMKKADIPDIKIPQNFDWREYDAVTEVKDQGSCGSCWAFSVTGNIEGQWKMQSGQLVSLSEQELVDCDKLDNGCNGGLPDNAYRAIEQMGGLELESDYPYEGVDEKCEFNKTLARVKISSAVNITSNETGMAQWLVHNGPISIGINANAMQFYMGGISHPWKMLCNPTNLDHGVLLVGYGIKEYPLFHKELPFWIVKNSWGKSWGEQGYYRVYRGDGTCGVNQMASSAVI